MRIGLNALARAVGLRPPSGLPAAGYGSAVPVKRWALAEALAATLSAERERWFPWAVASFVAGIVVYFALSREPALWLSLTVGAAGLGLALFRPRGRVLLNFALLMIAAAGLGFAAAKLRTDNLSAPVIERDTGAVKIEGRIETVLPEDATHARIILIPSRMDKRTDLPRRLRLTLRGAKAVAAVAPGRAVSLRAMVMPPPEPVIPSGYDFARWAYFQGIGGVGFVLGAPVGQGEAKTSLWQTAVTRVERLRLLMSERVRAALPAGEGAIAAALITGERAAVSDEDNAAYRDSGLFHVLSISGVHMALAGLGIFWIVRALLALWPRVALTQPIKKWAAVAALAASTFYLFVSGAGAPAVRSYIMLSAMLLGVLADRPALSMRAVAISAALILLAEPESAIDPSFQMSFAAIIGLIALAEWQRAIKRDGPPPEGIFRVLVWLRRYFVGLVVTSIIAGLATAPFAIFHFDRAPGYSLLANFLATPLVGLVIMPAACFTVIAMPFGLKYWPLQMMGWGVRAMTAIAHFVADLPGAVSLVPAWSGMVLVLIVTGLLWVGLWQRRWRWLGLLPAAFGLVIGFLERPPDVLVSRDGNAAAVRGADRKLILLGTPDDYTAEQWLLRDGDARLPADAKGTACDEWGCTAGAVNGHVVALALRVGALSDDCDRADVLVSTVPLRTSCPHPIRVVDRFDVLDGGAYALWFERNGVRALSVAEARGQRPWAKTQ